MDRKRLTLASMLMLVSACAATTKSSDVKPLTTNGAILESPEEAKLLKKSQQTHDELLSKGLIIRDEEVNDYIANLAAKVSPDFTHPSINLNFYVLRDASVNATAFPNGNIYLNAGLISKLTSEEQLAFVIAHEIVHVINRHSLLMNISSKNTIASSHVANMLLMGTNLIYFATLSELSSFSREKEDEADYGAMKLLHASAINLSEGAKAISNLRMGKNNNESASIWSSHPDIDERLSNFSKRVESNNWQEQIPATDVAQYQKIRAKLADQVINIRLRHKQFALAEDVVTQELVITPDNPKFYFYMGEIQRLKVKHPDATAIEHAWLYGVKDDEKLRTLLSKKHADLLTSAQQNYEKALLVDDNFTLSYRGLAMLALHRGEKDQAKAFFDKYLSTKNISDRRYITSIRDSIH
ncbi:DUF2225 domain-containing protein [Shewanella sp.]|uniref:DUF2225 domain-containing protein n=1 Tax=Shewanella sp. TaxID=50422 RepID=UPI0035689DBB